MDFLEDLELIKLEFVADNGVSNGDDEGIASDGFWAAAVGMLGAYDIFPVGHDGVLGAGLADFVKFEVVFDEGVDFF